MFDESYREILKNVMENGLLKENRTGVDTRSVFTQVLVADDSEGWDGFPVTNLRRLYVKGAIVETMWFMGLHYSLPEYSSLPLTNTKFLTDHNVRYWERWTDENGNLGPVYGEQLTRWKKYVKPKLVMDAEDASPRLCRINQLQYIIDTLRQNPDDRRLVTSIWNPSEIEEMALPPCHYSMEFYSRPVPQSDGSVVRYLDTTWHQRSADMPIGIPFNVLQYTLVNKIISLCTGHVPGVVRGVLGNTHVYVNQEEAVREMLSRDTSACPRPRLRISERLMKLKEERLLELSDIDPHGSDFTVENYEPLPRIDIPVAV